MYKRTPFLISIKKGISYDLLSKLSCLPAGPAAGAGAGIPGKRKKTSYTGQGKNKSQTL